LLAASTLAASIVENVDLRMVMLPLAPFDCMAEARA
jgi:hypothetical protein